VTEGRTSAADHVSFSRLGEGYRPDELANGLGFRIGPDTVFCHNGDPVRFIAYLEFAAGKPRGNHFHKEKTEYLCVLKGSLRASFSLFDRPDDVVHRVLGPGDLVTVLPGCVHTYVADEHAAALEYSPQPFDPDDTYRLPTGDATSS
jgi:quercetin dioxygenase-like cupin family protein